MCDDRMDTAAVVEDMIDVTCNYFTTDEVENIINDICWY